jgi:7-carboxy-7-deazaguanine synthase
MNLQDQEPLSMSEDGNVQVVKIWNTIQGEGEFAGSPAIFIRLAGCNLQCPHCDTDYTSVRVPMNVHQISQRITTREAGFERVTGGEAIRWARLVVLTGGEPLRQNVQPLVWHLMMLSHWVQIETNGTLDLAGLPRSFKTYGGGLSICCSPKAPKIHKGLRDKITSYKYVLHHASIAKVDGLPLNVLGSGLAPARPDRTDVPIFVQPEWSDDAVERKLNMDACAESAIKFGYRVSLQMHKIMGLE